MTRRDYFIIFCLLLPFFITLPWALNSYGKLGDQRELTELTRDTLHLKSLEFERLQVKFDALEEANRKLVDANDELEAGLKARGVKVITRYLPAPAEAFTATQLERQRKIEQLTDVNENLYGTIEQLRKSGGRDLAPPPDPAPAAAPTKQPASGAVVVRSTAEVVTMVPDDVRTVSVNQRMDEQVKNLALKDLRANAFSVRILREMGGDSLKTDSQSRKMQISFGVDDVPADYQGERSLYLVVTNRRGEPVTGENPVKAMVPFGGMEVELMAMAARKMSLGTTQRVVMEQELKRALPAGQYRAQVFSDLALLGMTDFVVK
jgi:hypothetical protein